MATALRLLALLALTLVLSGCGAKPGAAFKATDITGTEIGPEFALTDHNGDQRHMADFRGKVVVLFFGYTHCPDVCPTTLSDLASALKSLPPSAAAEVQGLFVTVDPERDTPDLLKQYVPYFHPDFLGLYGSPAEIAKVAQAFRIHYRKHVEPGATDYLVDHTAGSYVFDQKGRARLFLPYGQAPDEIAHDLALLLSESP